MKKWINTLVILIVLGCTRSICAPTDTLSNLQQRITTMEKEREILERDLKSQATNLNANFNALKCDWETKIGILLYIGLPLTLFAIIAAACSVYLSSRKLLKEKIEAELTTQFQNNKSKFVSLITHYDEETTLKESKKVLVLTEKNASENYVVELFQRTGFKNVIFKKIDAYQNFGDFDLIFYNFCDVELPHPLFESYIQNSSNSTMHFLFGKKYITTHLTENLSFSSVKSQIYGNLMNQLKYQDLIINFK